ncbi:ABC transporter substrate-binding protein [Bosea sp. BIWAKO-01]|uniref:ABC transporter substrate-binding protein n=1 Tax=Bosea sp. BIWAKO-01 TaxID=506668 RepID=UPI000852ADCD|nr:ABC transporter substrate-binding protein [Bosea sp. BIWAKO-01]GAU80764.1 oligopeptide ABC transporter periplasmic oligopeptide-binding protein OppA [Bosea sp. BIWAKO-01]
MRNVATFASRAAIAAALSLVAGAAVAQELRIGISAEPSAMDPHYHNLTPNNMLARHIYEPLVGQDASQRLVPSLAESWKAIDDTTWEFKLRQNVKFHDGSPFTADDVLATFQRAPNVPKSPSSFSAYVRGKEISKVDDYTIRIKTAAPAPLVPTDLSTFGVISAKCKDTTTEEFNAGKCAAGGTGPYKQAEFVSGDRVVMTANDSWWGGSKDLWKKVTFRIVTSAPTRVAALLAGDVDMIEAVPTSDVAKLKGDKNLNVVSQVSNRVVYFHMDHFRDVSPFIKGKDGSEIKNPLRDVRVRKALSMAINRPGIVERIMEKEAIPAGQLLPDSFFGTSKNLKPVAFDLAGAKKLLAEAGYPNGFKMKMHGPNGRYTNDTKIIEAVAQMFARLGIETEVETLPPANFFTRASQGAPGNVPEFSFILVGWAAGTGESSDSLKALLATFNPQKGMGATNRGRYSNPAFDAKVEEGLRTVDDKKRDAIFGEAMEIGMNDVGLIPTHFQLNTWAARKGFKVEPRSDEYTLATSVTKQ